MAKIAAVDVETIKRRIIVLTKDGFNDQAILNKLEEMPGLAISMKTLHKYRSQMGEEITAMKREHHHGTVVYYIEMLEQALQDKIMDAKKGLSEAKNFKQKDYWHEVLVEAWEKFYLLKSLVVQGVATRSLVDDPETLTEGSTEGEEITETKPSVEPPENDTG